MQNYTDYLVVIVPPDAIIKEISRYKRASVNLIGHFEGMHRPAQIIVTQQTRCKPFMVRPVIEQMASKISTMPPVELSINGFGYFSVSHTTNTIYAAIEHTSRTDKWFKLLKSKIGIKTKNFVPHIAIASNIPVTAFNKLWPNFENRQWSETFEAGTLTMLHKDTFVDYTEWKVYKELFFTNRLKEII